MGTPVAGTSAVNVTVVTPENNGTTSLFNYMLFESAPKQERDTPGLPVRYGAAVFSYPTNAID